VILALESSCDETALAFFDPLAGVACEWIQSQMEMHSEHGGVVPDLATREHLRNFGPLIAHARSRPEWDRITEVAVTRGPGLAACLAIGVAAAKAVGAHLGVPVSGVNHLRAHAWSPFIALHGRSPDSFRADLATHLPHLGLIVSGGNTILFCISDDLSIRQISSTRDDAAGEALDKGAKLLGLGYPGGPLIERKAEQGRPGAFDFPRGLGGKEGLDFSFSGLKTSLRYRVQAMPEADVVAAIPDLCASYQAAVVDALAGKMAGALRKGSYRSVGLSGGVANNRALRAAIQREAAHAGARFFAAEPAHTGDNAAMIGFAAWAEPDAGNYRGAGLCVDPSAYL
jgi:N6-L-threonylcarbamoyladenine synthase